MTDKSEKTPSFHPYDDLNSDLRSKFFDFVKTEIPRIYEALRTEGLSPVQARIQIEKDLAFMRSKRVILEYLPYEARGKPRLDAGTIMRDLARIEAELHK